MSRRVPTHATLALMFARAGLVAFVTLALVLAPSIGHLAIQERNWAARAVMLTVLAGVWCSYVALAAARAHTRHLASHSR